jgi:uncharacterized protein
MLNIPIMALKMLRVVMREKPDLMIGIGSSRITHAGFLTGTKTFIFTDTEHAKEQILLYKPFATRIYTPDCFLSDLGDKQFRYPSYHELAYLHPDEFFPDRKFQDLLELDPGQKLFILRFVSWNASHDVGQRGLSDKAKIDLVRLLEKHGRVVITSECQLPKGLESYLMKVPAHLIHHMLYFAEMYIGEGGTMASEAAVLGTPSIFVSTLSAGTFEELRDKYSLLVSCNDDQQALRIVADLLQHSDLKDEWRVRQKKLISEKINTTQYMYDEIMSCINKV